MKKFFRFFTISVSAIRKQVEKPTFPAIRSVLLAFPFSLAWILAIWLLVLPWKHFWIALYSYGSMAHSEWSNLELTTMFLEDSTRTLAIALIITLDAGYTLFKPIPWKILLGWCSLVWMCIMLVLVIGIEKSISSDGFDVMFILLQIFFLLSVIVKYLTLLSRPKDATLATVNI